MAEPPQVMLEASDREALKPFYSQISQLKRQISLQIGKPESGDDMYSVTSLRKLLGDPPSQARMTLVTAQAQVTMEEITTTMGHLETAAFDAITNFESMAYRSEVNS